MSWRPKRGFVAAWLVIIVAAAIYCGFALRWSHDIAAFVADGGDPQQARLVRALAQSPASRVLTVVVQIQCDQQPAIAASLATTRALADDLRDIAEVAWVRNGSQAAEQEEL